MSRPLWLPGAIRKPIPQGANDPKIIPAGDIFHIAVTEASSLYGWFNGPSGGIESTGYIRRDGTVEQYRPFNVECDAQGDGNSFIRSGRRYGFCSWETQGMGDGYWTAKQVATIKRIIEFRHEHYGVPYRQAPAWNMRGFGYHRMYDRWNPNRHSCPGDDRVRQWRNVIVPWMADHRNEPRPGRPDVSLSAVITAAHRDPSRVQGGVTKGSADDVKRVEWALYREGLLDKRWATDGSFGTSTRKAYSQWQRRLGYRGADADGIPGRTSLTLLGRKYGFDVVK